MGELMIKVTAILVNGKREEESYLLEGGDRIGLFSPIGGGQR
jgi:molybdopterin converting factor small subunit